MQALDLLSMNASTKKGALVLVEGVGWEKFDGMAQFPPNCLTQRQDCQIFL
jgi:hypothetical protein